MSLKNRVAVVTGGAQGIGGAIANRLAADGAYIMIADIHEERAQARVDAISAAGHLAQYLLADVSDRAQVAALFEATTALFGRVDILVNNAAVVHNPQANAHFLDLSDEIWLRTLAVNLTGLFYCSQAAARLMVTQGEGGSIVNIGSGGGSRAHRQMMAYDTTKGGIEAATRALALDLAPWKIRVNTVVPGNITVPNSLGGATGPEAAQRTIPLGHPGAPEDIAAAVSFLCSAEARYITGQRLFVDGGMDAQLRSPGVDTPIDPEVFHRLKSRM